MKAYVSTSNVALLLHILFTLKNIHHKERNTVLEIKIFNLFLFYNLKEIQSPGPNFVIKWRQNGPGVKIGLSFVDQPNVIGGTILTPFDYKNWGQRIVFLFIFIYYLHKKNTP